MPTLSEHLEEFPYLRKGEPQEFHRILSMLPKNPVILEIGTFKGLSAMMMSKMRPDAEIITIDSHCGIPSEPKLSTSYEAVIEKLREHNCTNIKHIPVSSEEFVLSKTIDLLFIDGDHTFQGVSFDFHKFSHYVKKGGFIIFHDFGTHKGVTQFCRSLNFQKAIRTNSLFICKNDS